MTKPGLLTHGSEGVTEWRNRRRLKQRDGGVLKGLAERWGLGEMKVKLCLDGLDAKQGSEYRGPYDPRLQSGHRPLPPGNRKAELDVESLSDAPHPSLHVQVGTEAASLVRVGCFLLANTASGSSASKSLGF